MAKKERADAASAVGERSALAVAEGLKAEIAGIADQIEADRQLPESLVSALKARGALRFLIPSEVGGAGVALPDFISGLQTFAEADASTAWCVSQGAVIATTTLWLGEDVLREFWADPEMAVANGPPRGCTATPIAEGYRVNGDWGFSSGRRGPARGGRCLARRVFS
jgi:alkylation response protein AidB-like acyl-CoA dehydrogenase